MTKALSADPNPGEQGLATGLDLHSCLPPIETHRVSRFIKESKMPAGRVVSSLYVRYLAPAYDAESSAGVVGDEVRDSHNV